MYFLQKKKKILKTKKKKTFDHDPWDLELYVSRYIKQSRRGFMVPHGPLL